MSREIPVTKLTEQVTHSFVKQPGKGICFKVMSFSRHF